MINWGLLRMKRNRQAIEADLEKMITAENYGKGEGKWCLSELFAEGSDVARAAARMVAGTLPDGKPRQDGPLKSNGVPMTFRLRVLSRQACTKTVDGEWINTWDTTATAEPGKACYTGELCPLHSEPPKPGDEVWIKGDAYTHDKLTGKPTTKSVRQAMVARMELDLDRTIKPQMATHAWTQIKVDDDLCITVGYAHAAQLLRLHGKRLAKAKWTATRRKDNPSNRMITNWLFEEVTPDDVVKTRQPRTRKRPEGATEEG